MPLPTRKNPTFHAFVCIFNKDLGFLFRNYFALAVFCAMSIYAYEYTIIQYADIHSFLMSVIFRLTLILPFVITVFQIFSTFSEHRHGIIDLEKMSLKKPSLWYLSKATSLFVVIFFSLLPVILVGAFLGYMPHAQMSVTKLIAILSMLSIYSILFAIPYTLFSGLSSLVSRVLGIVFGNIAATLIFQKVLPYFDIRAQYSDFWDTNAITAYFVVVAIILVAAVFLAFYMMNVKHVAKVAGSFLVALVAFAALSTYASRQLFDAETKKRQYFAKILKNPQEHYKHREYDQGDQSKKLIIYGGQRRLEKFKNVADLIHMRPLKIVEMPYIRETVWRKTDGVLTLVIPERMAVFSPEYIARRSFVSLVPFKVNPMRKRKERQFNAEWGCLKKFTSFDVESEIDLWKRAIQREKNVLNQLKESGAGLQRFTYENVKKALAHLPVQEDLCVIEVSDKLTLNAEKPIRGRR